MIIRNFGAKFAATAKPKKLSNLPTKCQPLATMDARQFLNAKSNGLISIRPEYSGTQIFKQKSKIDNATDLKRLQESNKAKLKRLKNSN